MPIKMKELPETERPYEKLEQYGAEILTNAELLAIIIKTGTKDETAVGLAQQILKLNTEKDDNLKFLMELTVEEFMKIKGIGKVKANDEFLKEELNNTPEILAEAVQTILRKNGYKNAYEILKNMTRGRNITIQEMRDFIQKLEIDETDKNVLLNLKPQDYLGLAEELVKRNEK